MANKRSLLLSLLLLGPTVAVASDVSPVHALSYPAAFAYFPKCTTADQEFCIELFEINLDSGGGVQEITDPTGNTEHYLQVFISDSYSGPAGTLGMGGMFPSLSINYIDPDNYRALDAARDSTVVGLDAGTYRTVIRIGDYDPSYMLLSGDHVDYEVTKGTDGYFTVDLTARPKPYGGVVVLDGDMSMMNACVASKWIANCVSNNPYRSYLLTSFTMAGTPAQRESLRGTWLATNASTFSLGTVNIATGEFGVNVAGPHYLPDDFGPAEGSKIDPVNGRQIAPAYFKMFMPYTSIAAVLKQVIGIDVSVELVKAFLQQPKDVLAGTIEKVTGKNVTETTQQLDFDTATDPTGVIIDFNIDHYSAPNPRLTIGRGSKSIKGNGAVIRPITKAARGKTYKSKTLFSPATGTSVTKVKSSTTKICKTVGTSVKMLKPGNCKLSVTTSKSRKSASTSVVIKIT